jgi:hypothetical protein
MPAEIIGRLIAGLLEGTDHGAIIERSETGNDLIAKGV